MEIEHFSGEAMWGLTRNVIAGKSVWSGMPSDGIGVVSRTHEGSVMTRPDATLTVPTLLITMRDTDRPPPSEG